jgi:class 3 adenylate cyclase
MSDIAPRRSPEIQAVVVRIFDAFGAGDIASMSRIFNPGSDFAAIGTDPDEWWDGETFLPVMNAQMKEMAGLTQEILHVEGWELDRVGWATGRVRMTLGDSDIEMRVTAVLVLDAGLWRVVQWHASEGVPNVESLGFSLTTTITEILEAIDVERDLLSLPSEGMVTLMFTDVEGSTGHARELGDREFTRLMTEHLALVAKLADRWGGQVVKSVGDGALLSFSSTRSALGSAVDIQRATKAEGVPYAIRIGVHAGDVVRTDSDVMGFAVNKAARVASAATGGQIVVSSVVKELVGFDPSFRFGDSFFAELRGIDGVHELVPVDWSSSSDDRGTTESTAVRDR